VTFRQQVLEVVLHRMKRQPEHSTNQTEFESQYSFNTTTLPPVTSP